MAGTEGDTDLESKESRHLTLKIWKDSHLLNGVIPGKWEYDSMGRNSFCIIPFTLLPFKQLLSQEPTPAQLLGLHSLSPYSYDEQCSRFILIVEGLHKRMLCFNSKVKSLKTRKGKQQEN